MKTDDVKDTEAEHFYNQVVQGLNKYDKDRVSVLVNVVCLIPALVLGGIFFFYLVILFFKILPDFILAILFGISLFLFLGAFFIYPVKRKDFEERFKRKIFRKLLKPYDLQYAIGNYPMSIDYNAAGITSGEVLYECYDDIIYGEYKGVPLNIAELSLECVNPLIRKSSYTAARGIVIQIQFNKNIIGQTYICSKGSHLNISNSALKKINLEDSNFNKEFDVYSDDEIESRYLLTTAFIDRLKQIKFSFRANKILFSFVNQQLIILLENSFLGMNVTKDFFEFSLLKPLTNKSQIFELYNDVKSVLNIIEHFKLYYKIGL